MKAYTYTPQECGMAEFPAGLLRLEGVEVTPDPRQADVFVVPPAMYAVGKPALLNLPYLKGNERRHVMLNVAEWRTALGLPALMFRCDVNTGLQAADPTAIAWPWPVEDLEGWRDRAFERDVVFVGWRSTPLTDVVCDAVERTPALSSHIQRNATFYGYMGEAEQARLHQIFLETLATSRLSLAARSAPEGFVRYRVYEAFSMGRIPVHFCDHCVMPFADRIDYDTCMIQIPEADAPRTGEILAEWLATHSDAEIKERGAYGRAMWERWLDSRKWEALFTEVVKEKLHDL